MKFSAQQLADLCQGTLLRDGDGENCQFDSRLLKSNEWFLVLQGVRDGHDFLNMAANKSCAGAIGQRMPSDWKLGFVQVEDSLSAFQRLAHQVRLQYSGLVIGITGSAGKTTTRALISSVLAENGSVHQTAGNFNNHIGVPKTITDSQGNEDFWVLEMGMNALGEIDQLQKIAEPNIRIITNIGAAHVEGCGSIEGVARAKGELFAGAREGDICCVNADDFRVSALPIPKGAQIVKYGRQSDCDIRLLTWSIEGWNTLVEIQTPKGIFTSSIPVPGEFMAINALAATAVGLSAGLTLTQISKGLQNYEAVGMRMRLEKMGSHQFINDAYNANLISMTAALKSLAVQPHLHQIALLGDMLEMGDAEDEAHRQVIELGLNLNVTMGLVGPRFHKAYVALQALGKNLGNVQWLTNTSTEMAEAFVLEATPSIVLLKGSRGMKMEQILQTFKNNF